MTSKKIQQPNYFYIPIIKSNIRVFIFDSGYYPAPPNPIRSTKFYTVPQNMMVNFDCFIITTRGVINSNTVIKVYDKNNKELFDLDVANNPTDINLIYQPIKLISGDQIVLNYSSNDLTSGNIQVYLQGIEQTDPVSIPEEVKKEKLTNIF